MDAFGDLVGDLANADTVGDVLGASADFLFDDELGVTVEWTDTTLWPTSNYRFHNEIKRGWGHSAVLPYHPQNANRIEFQNRATLPVTYYEWYDLRPWRWWNYRSHAGRLHNWIEDPSDPTMLKMDISYGPLVLYDVDAMA